MHTDSISILSVDTSALYRAEDCATFFSIGLSTWWSWTRTGKAKPGIKLGGRTTVWEGSYLAALKHQLLSEAANCRVASSLQTPFATPIAGEVSSAPESAARIDSGEGPQ
ncbi:hypothetical protein SAMN05216562_2056 [Microbulbifer marinus]|uniref:Transcriptional regulator, AlpA family n=1 Tax=Microbulbifer marinus TaxID=658218 RepID=A0A1H3YZA3_9GAMM|nr:hypothetical protein SAMN05216562_2056 [Microbulbifer marinus]